MMFPFTNSINSYDDNTAILVLKEISNAGKQNINLLFSSKIKKKSKDANMKNYLSENSVTIEL